MTKAQIRVRISGTESENAYVTLPGYPVEPQGGVVSRTISLEEVIPGFKGPCVNLDFDRDGLLIGIEIIA